MKKYFRSETIIYTVAIAVFLVTAGGLIFSDFDIIRKRTTVKSALGQVRPIGKDVRLRGEEQADWSQLRKDATVYRDDRVFTGAKSSALVTFKNKQKFTVEPNSLIKITDESSDTVFNMQFGSFFAELKQGTKFFVKSKDSLTEIKSNDASIRIESGQHKLKLVVLRGEAVASTGGEKNTIVKANEEADIEYRQIKVTPFEIELQKPAAGGIEWQQNKPVRFSWKTSAQKTVRFEVATDPGFESILVNKTLNAQQIDVPLTAGQVYFWRVAEEGDRNDRSPVSSFSLYALAAPVLHQEVLENKGELEFSWEDPGFSDYYVLQTSPSPDFSVISQTTVANEMKAVLPRPPAGDYYWRVLSKHPARADVASKENPLPVAPTEAELAARKLAEVPPPLGTPSLKEEEFKFELVEKLPSEVVGINGFVVTDLPRIDFLKAEHADDHQIELSYTEDFKQSFLNEKLTAEQWVWTKPQIGQFFVRLKAMRNKEDTYSSISKIRVIVAAPIFTELKLKGKANKPPALHGVLKPHPLAKILEVQIANNESFSSASISKIKEKSFNVLMKEPGLKYIRARSLNEDGWPISKYSKIQKINVEALVPEAEPIAPMVQKKEEPVEKEKIKEQKEQRISKKFKNHFNVWAGLGMNYLKFNQSGNSDLGAGGFAKLSMPTYSAGGRVQFSENQAVEFQYHDWPGQLVGPTSTNIDKTNYHLQSMSADYQHRLTKNGDKQTSLLVGYRIEQTPFLSVNATGDNVLYTNELQSGLLGAKVNFFDKQKLEYEIAMRYHLLASSKNLNSGNFKAKMGPMFDASFGLSKSYDNGFRFGLYWLLEYQNFNYSFTKDGTESNGNQNFLNSNIQFRIGYDFFGLTIIPIIPRRRRKKNNISN